MDFLEKWIWEKHRKRMSHRQLVAVSELDLERSAQQYSINKNNDLLLPLNSSKQYWGQLVIENGGDLNSVAIHQIIDLADLYFKMKVHQWTAPLAELNNEVQPAPAKAKAKAYYLKSSIANKANYVISYLQDRLNSRGMLQWNNSMDLEDTHLESMLLRIDDANLLNFEDFYRIAKSNRVPHLVFVSPLNLVDWYFWTTADPDLRAKIDLIEADLDKMPLSYDATKDCIDLMWFAD